MDYSHHVIAYLIWQCLRHDAVPAIHQAIPK